MDDLPDRMQSGLETEIKLSFRNILRTREAEFYQAGYDCKPARVIHIFNSDKFWREIFEESISTFYRGVSQRLEEENDPFERAFVFLATWYSFIPTKSPSDMLEHSRQIGALTEEAYIHHLQHRHGTDADDASKKPDYPAILAQSLLHQAGAELLFGLEMNLIVPDTKKEEGRIYGSQDGLDIIQQFQTTIDKVIFEGRLPVTSINANRYPAGFLQGQQPIEMLKVISQNAERFVRRYAALYDYTIA